MEANQTIDFSIPRRQPRIAIAVILIKFLRQTVKALWPVLISFFIGGRNNTWFEEMLGYFVIAFAAFNLIGSVLTFWKTQSLSLTLSLPSRRLIDLPSP